jgi:hypothetical protein
MWLICYASVFLVNVIVFHLPSATAGDVANRQMADTSKTIVKVSASSNAALNPTIVQTEMATPFTRPIIPASLGTIFFGLWVYCGYELSRVGYRGSPPSLK